MMGAELDENEYKTQRRAMVDGQVRSRGVVDERVLEAMVAVPRHLFVPEQYRQHAHADRPWPIGHGQTISQPLMVALMLEAARLTPGERVLEVGGGSGYQAALLGQLVREVVALEIVPALAERARQTVAELGYDNVEILLADGNLGHEPKAPYDAILVAAAAPTVPEALIAQLTIGGRLLMPVGGSFQQTLLRLTKKVDGSIRTDDLGYCVFVPLVG